MTDELAGLRDKIYWRPTSANSTWHAYKKAEGGGYVSLCGRRNRIYSGGQTCARPPSWLRCASCDGIEMDRRGSNEGMPESSDWRDYA